MPPMPPSLSSLWLSSHLLVDGCLNVVWCLEVFLDAVGELSLLLLGQWVGVMLLREGLLFAGLYHHGGHLHLGFDSYSFHLGLI